MEQAASRVRAVFVDLDGTLLNKQHLISDYTAKVLHKLKEVYVDSVCFVVATGRPFHYVREQIENCHLHVDYIISSNGTRINRGDDLSLVRAHDIPPRTVQRLFQVNVEAQNKHLFDNTAEGLSGDVTTVRTMSTNIFIGTRWFCNYKIAHLGNSYPPHMQPEPLTEAMRECLRITNPLTASATAAERAAAAAKLDTLFKDVSMLFFYAPHENLLPAAHLLQTDDYLQKEVSFSFSLPHIIDVYPRNVDKSSAVREVCQLLNVDVKDAVAFGDGQNDITMLRAVGKGFVMANGQDSVKAALPDAEVIGTNTDDGVAKKLVQLFDLHV